VSGYRLCPDRDIAYTLRPPTGRPLMGGRRPLSPAEVKRRAAIERQRMDEARKESAQIRKEALDRALAETRQILRATGGDQ
jgi:hypothetical protein